MKKQLDKEQLNYVNGGAIEDYIEVLDDYNTLPTMQDALKREEEKWKEATTNPDAKKEKGDYKKTR